MKAPTVRNLFRLIYKYFRLRGRFDSLFLDQVNISNTRLRQLVIAERNNIDLRNAWDELKQEIFMLRRENIEVAGLSTHYKRERDQLQKVAEAARRLITQKYVAWGSAGGINNCIHGYGDGVPCPSCDVALVFPPDMNAENHLPSDVRKEEVEREKEIKEGFRSE